MKYGIMKKDWAGYEKGQKIKYQPIPQMNCALVEGAEGRGDNHFCGYKKYVLPIKPTIIVIRRDK